MTENTPAFPCEAQPNRSVPPEHDYIQIGPYAGKFPGMSLRDWFATFAPEPDEHHILTERSADRARNPHNDPHKPKLRSHAQIAADLRYRHADAMLEARKQGNPT